LQTRNEDAIRAEARQLIDKLWCRGGGFVAGFYSDEPSIGLDPKWQQIAMDEFMLAGKSQVI
jgi:uroporphyrinogen decarboxylase